MVPGAVVRERYRLERQLGQGGMGFVWSATELTSGRSVAMKFLRSTVNGHIEMRRRLLREARAAGAVNHPNVVEVEEVFELDDGTPVLVMALLHGETLRCRLKREENLSIEACAEVLLPVVSAVGTAHALGVIHRDLKPDNVFLCKEDDHERVKILDFGIAKLPGSDDADEGIITAEGATIGTPCYMSPERAFGEQDIDHRADIWSIGVMLYEALTGGRPVEGINLGQVLTRFTTGCITPIQALVPDLPADLVMLVSRMLARDIAERPADLREVFSVLSKHTSRTSPEFGPPAWMPAPDVEEAAASHRSARDLQNGTKRLPIAS
jgi:eukaryotic-like serine/threonine-protein kinase